MLAKEHRLVKKGARFVARRGYSSAGANLRIKWAPTREKAAKATVVAGLAFDKRAVRRNAIKRQLREILRPMLQSLRIPANIMVFVNKNAAKRTFAELREELIALLKRAGLI